MNRPGEPALHPRSDTLENLVIQNRLLRAQLDILQEETIQVSRLRVAAQGLRPGDRLECDREAYWPMVAAYSDPVSTTAEVYAGDQPLRLPGSRCRVLVQPDRSRARRLAECNPDAITLAAPAQRFFTQQPDQSLDSLVLHASSVTQESSPGALRRWIFQARRIARRQVLVVFEGGESLDDLGWSSADASEAIIIAAGDDSAGSAGQRFVALFNGDPRITEPRIVLISEWDPLFVFRPSDLVVCDIEIARRPDFPPSLNVAAFVLLPLTLLRSSLSLSPELLRVSILNYVVLENYVRSIPEVLPLGTDARIIAADLSRRLPKG